jgi:hypothetical protein
METHRGAVPLYFVWSDGKVRGPFSPGALSELLEKGMIERGALAALQGSNDWGPVAEAIQELGTGLPIPSEIPPASGLARLRSRRWFRWLLLACILVGIAIPGIGVFSLLTGRDVALLGIAAAVVILFFRRSSKARGALLATTLILAIALVLFRAAERQSHARINSNGRELQKWKQESLDRGEPPLFLAAREGREDLVATLLGEGQSVDESVDSDTGQRPIHAAAERGQLGTAKLLLAAGADLRSEDRYGYQAIHSAAWGGNAEMLKLLREAGASLEARTGQSIRFSGQKSKYEDSGTDTAIRQMGANPVNGMQPIHVAAKAGRADAVNYLLEQGVQPDVPDNNGRTPRDYATAEGELALGRLEVVKILNAAKPPP